jgi:hypothetical protein
MGPIMHIFSVFLKRYHNRLRKILYGQLNQGSSLSFQRAASIPQACKRDQRTRPLRVLLNIVPSRLEGEPERRAPPAPCSQAGIYRTPPAIFSERQDLLISKSSSLRPGEGSPWMDTRTGARALRRRYPESRKRFREGTKPQKGGQAVSHSTGRRPHPFPGHPCGDLRCREVHSGKAALLVPDFAPPPDNPVAR